MRYGTIILAILWLLPALSAQNVTAILDHGDRAYELADVAGALVAYEEAFAIAPRRYEVLTRLARGWNDLGRIHLRRSDSSETYYRRAVQYADLLAREHPDSATSWFLLALCHGSLTPFKSIREKLDIAQDVEKNVLKALRKDSTLSMAHVLLAVYYRGASRLTWWERSIVNGVLGRGIIGTIEDADRSVQRALRLDPRNPYAWYELYWIRRAQGQNSQATEALRMVLSIPAGDPRQRHQHKEARGLLGRSTGGS